MFCIFSNIFPIPTDTTRTPTNHSRSHNSHPKSTAVVPSVIKPTSDKPAGPGSGFMSSYLKFLQGERDTSPPPAIRGGKKQTWAARTPLKPEEKPPDTNGVPINPPVPPVPPPPPPVVPQPVTRLSQGDPQDDPRYFPLPKERKRRSFDDSDDGFSSDDGFFGRKKPSQPSAAPPPPPKPELKEKEKEKDKEKEKPKEKVKKERIKVPKPPSEKKKKEKPPKPEKEKKHKEKVKEPKAKKSKDDNVPRREQTKRAAKGKTNLSEMSKDDEPEEPPEFQDSDSDPAWTPAAKNTEEDLILPVKKKKGRPSEYNTFYFNLVNDVTHIEQIFP